jgi:phospholipase D1/2
MHPAPIPNEDETELEEDARVADPLSGEFFNLWNTTARVNREVFTELFRPIPSNLVRNWDAYEVSAHRPCRSVRLMARRRVGI